MRNGKVSQKNNVNWVLLEIQVISQPILIISLHVETHGLSQH